MDISQTLSAISGIQSTATTVEAKDDLGRDDFLTMFLAQLQNQDPLNPMESQEFSAQLAQFSSLEQLFNVNETLEGIKASQDDSSGLQAVNFIGKEIVAEGDALSLQQGKTVSGQFDLPAMADCTVRILSEEGYAVRTIPMGILEAGSHSFQWDGYDGAGNALAPGVYRFQVLAMDQAGGVVAAETRLSGMVTGVNLEGSPANLYVGDIPVSISEVMEIREPAASTTEETA